jgi:hypothetical protein
MGPLAYLVSAALSRVPGFTEATYGTRVGPALSWALSRASGVFPFSIAELLVAVFLMRQLHGLATGLYACVRGRRSVRNAAAAGALRLGQDLGVVVAAFYLLWGFQYARPPLESRLGWSQEGAEEIDVPAAAVEAHTDASVGGGVEPLAALAEEMTAAANEAYLDLHGSGDAGAPTTLRDADSLDVSIEEGWRRASELLALKGPSAARHGASKRLVASSVLDRLGISGFYFPLTGEANVNRGVPAVAYPQTVAHEKSHQRGIAPEDEANFLGFLAASLAPDPNARYSACVFAQRQLLFALFSLDAERAQKIVETRLPGVQRDIDDLRAYWDRHRGRAREISQKVNDAYLKTNRVEGGVASYGRSVELLVAYAQTRGGTLR